MMILFTPENAARAAAIQTNKRLASLTRRYGRPVIDFFGDSWRIWFQGWHRHMKFNWGVGGSHGGFAAQGTTLDEAMDRLENLASGVAPDKGFHCDRTCPHYEDDLY